MHRTHARVHTHTHTHTHTNTHTHARARARARRAHSCPPDRPHARMSARTQEPAIRGANEDERRHMASVDRQKFLKVSAILYMHPSESEIFGPIDWYHTIYIYMKFLKVRALLYYFIYTIKSHYYVDFWEWRGQSKSTCPREVLSSTNSLRLRRRGEVCTRTHSINHSLTLSLTHINMPTHPLTHPLSHTHDTHSPTLSLSLSHTH
jgi:hypothetical protein